MTQNVIERLDQKYRFWSLLKEEELLAEDGCDVDANDLYNAFKAEMETELLNLSAEDRMEIFASYVKFVEEELIDCYTEEMAGAAVMNMLILQLVRQVVRVNISD